MLAAIMLMNYVDELNRRTWLCECQQVFGLLQCPVWPEIKGRIELLADMSGGKEECRRTLWEAAVRCWQSAVNWLEEFWRVVLWNQWRWFWQFVFSCKAWRVQRFWSWRRERQKTWVLIVFNFFFFNVIVWGEFVVLPIWAGIVSIRKRFSFYPWILKEFWTGCGGAPFVVILDIYRWDFLRLCGFSNYSDVAWEQIMSLRPQVWFVVSQSMRPQGIERI